VVDGRVEVRVHGQGQGRMQDHRMIATEDVPCARMN